MNPPNHDKHIRRNGLFINISGPPEEAALRTLNPGSLVGEQIITFFETLFLVHFLYYYYHHHHHFTD
jgi:hypothetical protein